MATPSKILSSERSYELRHRKRIRKYEDRVSKLFEEAVREIAFVGSRLSNVSTDKPFSIDDHPAAKEQIGDILSALASDLEITIASGIKSEWDFANAKHDATCDLFLGDRKDRLAQVARRKYYSTNGPALEAFLTRKEEGLNISDRVWRYTNQFKNEIELALDLGISDGRSAAAMAREMKQYLQTPDALFRRVRDKYGNLHLSKAAKAFHPGSGVFRSSYKNARRLTATESNIAYRTADYLRYQREDFVLGIEIKLSNNHPVQDICDDLKGRYPKTFKFVGWHPLCRCYVISILKSDQEMEADMDLILDGKAPGKSDREITEVPDNFKKWVSDNADRIAISGYKGTTPYFLLDNDKFVHLNNFQATKLQKVIVDSRKEYLYHDMKNWRRDYFDRDNGGYLVIDRERILHSAISKNEKAKFDKEYRMCEVFARNGYRIEMLKERPGISSSDIRFNGVLAELKKTSSHNNIMNYAKKAIDKQGAKIVLFEFEKETKEIHLELLKLRKENIPIYYYFTKRMDLIYKL